MILSPSIYHRLIRPEWLTKFYITNLLTEHFDFSHKTVLDFGCGTGSVCNLFTPRLYLGIDPDPHRVAFAKKNYPNHHFSIYSNGKIPVEDSTIDYLIAISVLHHIPTEEIHRHLNEFKRILRPGGGIVSIEPYLTSSMVSDNLMTLFDQGKYIRNEEEYFKIFEANNFKVNLLKKFKKLVYNELFFFAVSDL